MLIACLAAILAAFAPAAEVAPPFPETYVGMVRRALAADPFYGSRLLTEVDAQIAGAAALATPAAVKTSLESAALGGTSAAAVRAELSKGALGARPAAALLVGNALARPEQFRQIMDGLESAKPGLGARLVERLSKADGSGDRRVIAALRAAGARQPQPALSIYTRDGRLEALFDGASPGVIADEAAPVPAQGYTGYGPGGKPRPSGLAPARPVPAPMPFPSLANMIAQSQGITRPPRAPLAPLPPQARADALTRDALGTLMMRMASRQNWGDVSYGASGHRGVEDKVRAQWMYEDSKADVNDYFARLTETQRAIAEAAFAGGLAETPALREVPDPVTLDWVERHYPSRH